MKISSHTINFAAAHAYQETDSCTSADCFRQGSIDVDTHKDNPDNNTSVNKTDSGLTNSQRRQVAQLQQRDSEVRAHEAAHIAAGGSVVSGGANFTYQEGPDGRLYAIGGEVPINIPSGKTPQESIAIAKEVQSAALAPANPSPQDFKVAATAALMEAKARQELALEKTDEGKMMSHINKYIDNMKSSFSVAEGGRLDIKS